MSITHFNGFDKGVIGKPLPADTTLNNMRKADLIELLHIAENNHDVLAQAYRIAVDNSKCHQCPLGRDREKIRTDAIESYRKEMHDIIEGNEEFIDWQKYEIFECNELVAEQLKEKK